MKDLIEAEIKTHNTGAHNVSVALLSKIECTNDLEPCSTIDIFLFSSSISPIFG